MGKTAKKKKSRHKEPRYQTAINGKLNINKSAGTESKLETFRGLMRSSRWVELTEFIKNKVATDENWLMEPIFSRDRYSFTFPLHELLTRTGLQSVVKPLVLKQPLQLALYDSRDMYPEHIAWENYGTLSRNVPKNTTKAGDEKGMETTYTFLKNKIKEDFPDGRKHYRYLQPQPPPLPPPNHQADPRAVQMEMDIDLYGGLPHSAQISTSTATGVFSSSHRAGSITEVQRAQIQLRACVQLLLKTCSGHSDVARTLQLELGFTYDRKRGSNGSDKLKKHLTQDNYRKWAAHNDDVAEKLDTVVKSEGGVKIEANAVKKDPGTLQQPLADPECAICENARRNTRFSPCSHSVCCLQCAENLVNKSNPCPECNTVIDLIEIGDWNITEKKKQEVPRLQASQSSEEDFA
ncbi:hypothetical protein TrRE_jg2905 [Triparma retinervis]|uniref:RING-type domain-containing protein n=1 Tax=Triparma retinervis TaxID=2557542 RepID=A0A9W7G416_9STRA|nr:hypothetical protein TrRE_jg2905 [Triparma retinervis]